MLLAPQNKILDSTILHQINIFKLSIGLRHMYLKSNTTIRLSDYIRFIKILQRNDKEIREE